MSPFIDISQSPPVQTKFNYTGNPLTNSGWTEFQGKRDNCAGTTGADIIPCVPSDRRFIMSSGAEDFTVLPSDTQSIYICQLIAQVTGKNSPADNLSSVTKLKQNANTAINFYNFNFTISIKKESSEIPSGYKLYQNFPNPFNPATTIKFEIPKAAEVNLVVYDMLGREVANLINEKLNSGTYLYDWNAGSLPSGVYFYKLSSRDYSEIKKMVLIK